MLLSDVENRLREGSDLLWTVPVRSFIMEGLDEIAGEVRSPLTLARARAVCVQGLPLPDLRVTKMWSADGCAADDLPFEQAPSGLLRLWDMDDAGDLFYIRGIPWWKGMRALRISLDSGVPELLTAQGDTPAVYVVLQPSWTHVVLHGPDGRVLAEGSDYVLAGTKAVFTDAVAFAAGDTVPADVWTSGGDFDLQIPDWTLRALRALRQHHAEQAVQSNYKASDTDAIDTVQMGPIRISSGSRSTSLASSRTSHAASHPAADNYFRILREHGKSGSRTA